MKKNNEKVEIEEKNNIKQKGKFKLILIIIIIFLIMIGLMIWIIKYDVFKKNDKKVSTKNNEKVILKHSNPQTVKSEGVYITDVSDVVDEVMPSIVSITSKTIIDSGNYGFYFYGGKYTTEGAGSGIIVSENDKEIFILTNYHVVKKTNELSVKFIDDKSVDAKVKGVSERSDIAIVSVDKSKLDSKTLEKIKIATLGNSDELRVGNGIIAIGNALGYGQSVTTGVVSALNREVSTDESSQDMIQIDAAINGGNSGGALLNSKGEVVGINTAKYSSSVTSSSASIEGMGFAIPISDVEDMITELIKGNNDEDGLLLGIEGYMTNSDELVSYGFPEGFYVSSILKDGNAANSELEIGNIIVKADDKEITSFSSLRKVLNKKNKGDTVKLTIKYAKGNEYKEKDITIKLEK